MTTLEFAKENRDQVIKNCPDGVSVKRFMTEFLYRFEKTSKEYGFVGYPAFYDAISDTVENIHSDSHLEAIRANNSIREYNANCSQKIMSIR